MMARELEYLRGDVIMAENVKINGVTYDSVPYVDVPRSNNSGDARFFDNSGATVTANDLRKGTKAMGASGEVTGNLETIAKTNRSISTKAQEVSIEAGIHEAGAKVSISATEQAKIIPGNIRSGVTILGVEGGLSAASIVQDGSTKSLRIS